MRIREGCILTATNSSDERVKSLIGCKCAALAFPELS